MRVERALGDPTTVHRFALAILDRPLSRFPVRCSLPATARRSSPMSWRKDGQCHIACGSQFEQGRRSGGDDRGNSRSSAIHLRELDVGLTNRRGSFLLPYWKTA